LMRVLGPLVGLVFVWVLFAILAGERFYDPTNQQLILAQTVVVGTAAIGATLIIVAGGIDLSVAGTIALATMTTAWALEATGSPWLALLAGVGTGIVIGLAIGAMVVGQLAIVAGVVLGIVLASSLWASVGAIGAIAIGIGAAVTLAIIGRLLLGRLEMAPFVVTLGLWGALRGAAEWVGDSQPIYADSTWLNDSMRQGTVPPFTWLSPGTWLMLGLAILMSLAVRYTRLGRHVFAIGSNEQTARLCGVNLSRSKLLIYTIGVAFAGLAGVLQFADLGGMGDPTTVPGYELYVIAAVVIGGASLSGGQGSILGTIIGALIITTVASGCVKMDLSNAAQKIVTGAIIVAAVALDRLRSSRSS